MGWQKIEGDRSRRVVDWFHPWDLWGSVVIRGVGWSRCWKFLEAICGVGAGVAGVR